MKNIKNISIGGLVGMVERSLSGNSMPPNMDIGIKIVGGIAIVGVGLWGCNLAYTGIKKEFKIHGQPGWSIFVQKQTIPKTQQEKPQYTLDTAGDIEVVEIKSSGGSNQILLPDGNVISRIETTYHWWGSLVRVLTKNPSYGYTYKSYLPMENLTTYQHERTDNVAIKPDVIEKSKKLKEREGLEGALVENIPPNPTITNGKGFILVTMRSNDLNNTVSPTNIVDMLGKWFPNSNGVFNRIDLTPHYGVGDDQAVNIKNGIDQLVLLPQDQQIKEIQGLSSVNKINLLRTIDFINETQQGKDNFWVADSTLR